MRRIFVCLSLLLALFLLPALASGETLAEWNAPERTIAVQPGTAAYLAVEKFLPNATLKYYNGDTDAYLAVKDGKVDAYAYDKDIMTYAIASGLTGVKLLDEPIGEYIDICVGLSPKSEIDDLEGRVNAFLAALRADGTLADMYRRWLTEGLEEMPNLPAPENPQMKIVVGTTGVVPPFTYYKDDKLWGFDLELVARFAQYMNAEIDVRVYDYDGIIAAAEAGTIDCAMANLNATSERREKINFSEPILQSATVLLVADAAAETSADLSTVAGARQFFAGRTVGIVTGTVFDALAHEKLPESEYAYFNGNADMITALKGGKIDAFIADKPAAIVMCNQNDGALYMPEAVLSDDSYGLAMAKDNTALCAQINATLKKLETDGTLARLQEKWFGGDESKMKMDDLTLTGERGVLRLATSADAPPFAMMVEGEIVGYDIEILTYVAKEYGYSLEIQNMDFAAIIPAITSGKADVGAACMSITEERKEQVLFSDPDYLGGVMLVTRSEYAPQETAAGANDLSTLESMREYFVGRTIGIRTGSIFDAIAQEDFPQSECAYFNSDTDMLAALKAGKIDGYMVDRPVGQAILSANPGAVYMPDTVIRDDVYAYALALGSAALCEQIDETLKKLAADGTLAEMQEKWFGGDESKYVMPKVDLTGENGELRVATDAGGPPFGLVKGDEYVGYDYEILLYVARDYGYTLDIQNMDFAAIIPALVSGKADVGAACMSITEERKEQVLFSDPNYVGGVMMLVPGSLDPAQAAAATVAPQKSFWENLGDSFTRTFVRENRWKLLLRGLGVTLLISVCSLVLGTLLGFGVCLMRRSRFGLLAALAKVFIRILQGTPIVVILMILYYLVFGDVEPVLVAVTGFSLNFAAYVSEMMRTGIEAVDAGQLEAASALGFTRAQVFLQITLPQAAKHFLPVYRGEFISLVKMTSVVGYISIEDLTKMSDIIRSRTYEAFFPLMATAVIYFLLSWLLASSISAVEWRIDPKHKKRVVKGVREG